MDVQHAAFLVGMVGLASFAPLFLLALPAGVVADHSDRKLIMRLCYVGEIAVVVALALASQLHFASTALVLGLAVAFGAARAFMGPANSALGPMLVPRELLPRSIAWNSLAGQTASHRRPGAGRPAGRRVARRSPSGARRGLYLWRRSRCCSSAKPAGPRRRRARGWALLREGLAYVWQNKIVFGAISLDLFAVLLGGATALLPVFARDVLHVGAGGLRHPARRAGGRRRAAWPSSWRSRPIRRHAGADMFVGVAVFGVATIVFGLSQLALALGRRAGDARRRRHAQRLRAPDPHPAGHAGPDARPGRRGQLRVHRRLQRARRVRERRGRALPGAGLARRCSAGSAR